MRSAGASDGEVAGVRVVKRKQHSNEASVKARGVKAAVQHFQHFGGGTRVFHDVLAQDPDRERAEERCGSPFAGDVAENESQPSVTVRKKIVEIAAEFARRNVGRGDIEAGDLTRSARQKLPLNFARGVEFTEETLFVAACLLVHTRIFERDGDERRK